MSRKVSMQDNPKPRSGVGKLYSRSKSTDGVASVVTRPLPTIPGDIMERLDDIIKWVDGNRACIWKDEDVADLRAAKAEIERLHNSFLVKTESEQETLKRIAWGEGYAVGCLAEKALREALEKIATGKVPRRQWLSMVECIEDFARTALSTSNDSGGR